MNCHCAEIWLPFQSWGSCRVHPPHSLEAIQASLGGWVVCDPPQRSGGDGQGDPWLHMQSPDFIFLFQAVEAPTRNGEGRREMPAPL